MAWRMLISWLSLQPSRCTGNQLVIPAGLPHNSGGCSLSGGLGSVGVTGDRQPASKRAPAGMPRRKILVVGDDVVVRVSVSEWLRQAGFEIVGAADADEARALLLSVDDIDLVFSDVNMPGAMDGVGLALWIVKRYPGIKVLLSSGASTPALQSQGGDLPFLAKPYRPRELMTRIGELLD